VGVERHYTAAWRRLPAQPVRIAGSAWPGGRGRLAATPPSAARQTRGGCPDAASGPAGPPGPDLIRFYTKTKTVTQRWPSAASAGTSGHLVIPSMT
jgi:hypothetical protein